MYDMRTMNILITAGPTREYFDSIRFISNPSSGKMGYAIAAAAAARGHDVTLVSGPVSLAPPVGVNHVQVVSADQMARAAQAAWPRQDVAIMTAAVCDYRPAIQLPQKMQKSDKSLVLHLVATEDIARSLGTAKQPGQVLVGFALEDHDGRAHAESKMRRKNFDAIVLNGPGNAGSDLADVEVLPAGGEWMVWRRAGKDRIAMRLVRLVEGLHRRLPPAAKNLPG
jgi:phosphopantothenoylcysteine decarboxylase / phosphopantothenate---cysteine ligase